MKAISGNLKAVTIEITQFERLKRGLLRPSLLLVLSVEGAIALFVKEAE